MVYEEKVSVWFAKILVFIFPLTGVYMLYLAYIQLTVGPIGTDPAPTWFYLLFGLFFLGLTWLMAQFLILSIRIEEKVVLLSYGVFIVKIDRENIEDVYLDTANPFLSYGGWGFRLGYYKGKSRKVMNIPGYKCVVVSRKDTSREIVFSTAHPEEIISLLRP